MQNTQFVSRCVHWQYI